MAIRVTPVNVKAANEGSWTNYYGIELCIARADNAKFKKKFMALTAPHQKSVDDDSMTEELMEKIVCKAMASAILVSWKPFEADVDGTVKKVEYSEANAFDLLKTDTDLRAYVHEYSNTIKNYLVKEEDRIKEKQ